MKPKNFIVIVAVLALAGLGVWWFTRPAAVLPAKIASAALPAPDAGPKPAAPSISVPTIAAPVPKAEAATVAAAPAVAPVIDPQVNLNTALADIARLIRESGDPSAFLETYTPPDKLDDKRIQQISAGRQHIAELSAQNPFFLRIYQQVTEEMVDTYEYLETQTPTYNDAGDEATYHYTLQFADGVTDQSSKTFIKVDGRWYMKPEDDPPEGEGQ